MDSQDPQQSQQAQATIHPSTPKEFHPDLARHIMDSEPLRGAFYSLYAGWRETYLEEKFTNSLGKEKIRLVKHIVTPEGRDKIIQKKKEDGADYIYETIFPLINTMMSTSNVNSFEIYYAWHARIREITWTLTKKIMFEENPYAMQLSDIPQIISNVAQLYLLTKKAEKGWTLNKIADQYSSSLIMHNAQEGGIQIQPKKEGIIDKIWKH